MSGEPQIPPGPIRRGSREDVNTRVNVPDSLAELMSPEWLTAALDAEYPAIEVIGVIPGRVDTRISTNAFFRIETGTPLPAGMPADLCGKGYFTDTGNWDFRTAGEPEAAFYRDMVEPLGVPTLQCVYADVDTATRHGVVITEDASVSGARFGEPLDPRSPAQVASTLDLYADLHARTWNATAVAGATYLSPRIASIMSVRSVSDIQDQFDGPLGSAVPPEGRNAEGLVAAYGSLPAISEASPAWCLLHGDAHIGNTYTDRAGQPRLLDWQLVQKGPWYLDVGYQIASALTVEDRRKAERDLLDGYTDRLSAGGAPRPSRDEISFGYCCGIVYGTYLWSITQKVRPDRTTALLGRLGTAALDHDAYRVVAAGGP